MSQPIWIALVLALVVAVAALVAAATGRATLRADAPAGVEHRHPVLLPADPRAQDVDHVRLAVAVPGYQRDQVDAVVAALQESLARRERRIAELEEERAAAAPAGSCGDSQRDPR
ncbi:cell division protein DivIVA [Micrococcus antarcticus]|uniref:cell division protein DivIVA n=1 Tax=Micrococcus antarcticus TaxID=86171 RepID=UPI0026075FB2|nr:cell division protein DivIVA [uncultured Micrococcus sp.]